jgi:hypothetical protein
MINYTIEFHGNFRLLLKSQINKKIKSLFTIAFSIFEPSLKNVKLNSSDEYVFRLYYLLSDYDRIKVSNCSVGSSGNALKYFSNTF